MSCLGNVIWFIFGGLIGGLSWLAAGILWCITIIGIPIGMQCFKIASLSFAPFGKEVIYHQSGMSLIAEFNDPWCLKGEILGNRAYLQAYVFTNNDISY